MIRLPQFWLPVLMLCFGCSGSNQASPPAKDSGSSTNEVSVVQPCNFDQIMACNDGNPCTQDRCKPNTFECNHYTEPMNDLLCDPQNLCVQDAECQDGVCVSLLERTCPSSDPCQVQACDPFSGGCAFSGKNENGTPCDDHNECTTGDQCDNGTCVGGPPPDCADEDPCTVDLCDPLNEGCQNLSAEGATCDDGNSCTIDSCDSANGACTHENTGANGQPCNDGSICTGEGICVDGVCDTPQIITCDDDNECTWDTCDPETGNCIHDGYPMTGVLCNDNNPCTDKDRCNLGVCKPGPTKSCNDFNPCTQDVCYQVTACCSNSGLVMNNVPCDDGNACTETGSCSFGICQPGVPIEDCCTSNIDCEDGDPCTEDTCANHHCTYPTIPSVGCCGETHLKRCTGSGITLQVCIPEDCGWDGNDYACGGNASEDPTGVHPKTCPVPTCSPQCGTNECGPDGCGGLCGTCNDDEVCGPAKLCVPSLILTIDFSDTGLRDNLDPNGDGHIEEDTEVFLSNGVQLVVTTEADLSATGIIGSAPFCFEGITLILPPAITWSTKPHQVTVRGHNTTEQLSETGLPLGSDVLGLPGKITIHYWADELFSQTEVSEIVLPYWAETGPQNLSFETPATLRLLQLHFGENGTQYEGVYIDPESTPP